MKIRTQSSEVFECGSIFRILLFTLVTATFIIASYMGLVGLRSKRILLQGKQRINVTIEYAFFDSICQTLDVKIFTKQLKGM